MTADFPTRRHVCVNIDPTIIDPTIDGTRGSGERVAIRFRQKIHKR
ncbi:MAG TPA: hypothetical protein VFG49_04230 [Dyella sp.]|nr:hypothetical protein [Dyella sp.]HET6552724.1 hypothetical protein [Dyella sp.]